MLGRPSKYPPEFRREAVELVKTSERPRVEIARSLGISDSTLANWMDADRDAEARAQDPDGLKMTEREELRQLRKEVIELRTDREISAKQPPISPGRRHGEPLPFRRRSSGPL
jgi:transposase